MPTDKPKPPNNFPLYFRQALEQGPGILVLDVCPTKQEALSVARKYRCFLKSIRLYPLHPLNRTLDLIDVRTKSIAFGGRAYATYVVVNGKMDLIAAITDNPI